MKLRWTSAAAVVTVTAIGAAIGVAVASTEPAAPSGNPATVGPQDQLVAATEDGRPSGGRVRDVTLVAATAKVRIGGHRAKTWAFNGKVPGPQIRVRANDILQARVVNHLPAPLTVHWHGVALRNDMDGVPDVTQTAIAPGASFTYRFKVPKAGTFFYHPHVGTELDRGLYGALIVDPAGRQRSTPRDVTLLLDDWIDGTGTNPDDVLAQLKHGMNDMGKGDTSSRSANPDKAGMQDMPGMGSAKSPLGSDIEDLTYPDYLVNGRTATDPATYDVRPGERVRVRLINAAASTPFRVATGGGRRLTVIASDGYAVKPVTVDTLLIGMGERYDILVTAPKSGSLPIVAQAEGLTKQALAVLRAGPGPAPRANVKPGGQSRIKAAKFPARKTLEEFDFAFQTSLKRETMLHLGQLNFLAGRENMILLGPPGTGKTHLAIALGIRACLAGHRVAFKTATEWVALLADAQRHGRLDDELPRLQRIPLQIVDEVGYIPFDPQAANLMFMLVSRRYERASLIVTSNKPFSAWGEIGDDVVAAAMIDRLVHHAEILALKGDSYRIKTATSHALQPPPTDRARRAPLRLALRAHLRTARREPRQGVTFNRRQRVHFRVLLMERG